MTRLTNCAEIRRWWWGDQTSESWAYWQERMEAYSKEQGNKSVMLTVNGCSVAGHVPNRV